MSDDEKWQIFELKEDLEEQISKLKKKLRDGMEKLNLSPTEMEIKVMITMKHDGLDDFRVCPRHERWSRGSRKPGQPDVRGGPGGPGSLVSQT